MEGARQAAACCMAWGSAFKTEQRSVHACGEKWSSLCFNASGCPSTVASLNQQYRSPEALAALTAASKATGVILGLITQLVTVIGVATADGVGSIKRGRTCLRDGVRAGVTWYALVCQVQGTSTDKSLCGLRADLL